MTSRRGFLGLLATVAAGATLDPERLLWVPGAKLISIPKTRSMADILREIEQETAAGMGISIEAFLRRKAAFGVSDEQWMAKKSHVVSWQVASYLPPNEETFVRNLMAAVE